MQVSDFQEVLTRNNIVQNVVSLSAVGGGCINDAYKLVCNKDVFFLKLNKSEISKKMFEKEAEALKVLAQKSKFVVPTPLFVAPMKNYHLLAMNFIESGNRKADFWEDFATKLFELHSVTNQNFGLENDNFIASLVQKNDFRDNWISFFVEMRILPFGKLLVDGGKLPYSQFKKLEDFANTFSRFFTKEKPALLHGDLWSGNFMTNIEGDVVLIDPAVYYGIPEVDIAMTKFFGGFHSDFYTAYESLLGEKFSAERIEVSKIYPLLVHAELFGLSYWYEIEQIVERFS
ncbi:MAG: fructosamine kinase family protein [Bacteroidales bacterium]|jgi:fructosamine-3-kinase|nr:fructosamine kinase family protein [Bacteroidales bacterium]